MTFREIVIDELGGLMSLEQLMVVNERNDTEQKFLFLKGPLNAVFVEFDVRGHYVYVWLAPAEISINVQFGRWSLSQKDGAVSMPSRIADEAPERTEAALREARRVELPRGEDEIRKPLRKQIEMLKRILAGEVSRKAPPKKPFSELVQTELTDVIEREKLELVDRSDSAQFASLKFKGARIVLLVFYEAPDHFVGMKMFPPDSLKVGPKGGIYVDGYDDYHSMSSLAFAEDGIKDTENVARPRGEAEILRPLRLQADKLREVLASDDPFARVRR